GRVFDQVVPEVSGVPDRDVAVERAERGQQQVLLVLPAPVERGLTDAGRARDGIEAESRPAGLGVDFQGRGEHPRLQVRIPGAARPAGLVTDRRVQLRLPRPRSTYRLADIEDDCRPY